MSFDGKDNIATPIFNEIDLEIDMVKKENTKDIYHIAELKHSKDIEKYTDLWILDHNSV